MRLNFIKLLLVLFISGCVANGDSESAKFDISYSAMLEKVSEQLTDQHIRLEKTIYYQGKVQKRVIENPVWKSELRPYIDCNVQTPEFSKLYSVEKHKTNDTLYLTYTAITEKSEIRKLELVLFKDRPEKIKAELFRKNSYFTLSENLLFEYNKGYKINGNQKMLFANETVYSIEARFVKPL